MPGPTPTSILPMDTLNRKTGIFRVSAYTQALSSNVNREMLDKAEKRIVCGMSAYVCEMSAEFPGGDFDDKS